jgi:hypothetical protein
MSEIRDLIASGVQRGKVGILELARELDLGPRQGSARLRLALGEVADGVRSVAEADLRSLVRQFRLPDPLYNPKLFVAGEFLAMPDAWWPDFGVAGEVESKAWHMSPADWQRTLDRQARMSAQGILGPAAHARAAPDCPTAGRQGNPVRARELPRPAAAYHHAPYSMTGGQVRQLACRGGPGSGPARLPLRYLPAARCR